MEAGKVQERMNFKRVWIEGKQQDTMSVFVRTLGFMKNGARITVGNRAEDHKKSNEL
jgi:hypothetical protein